MFHMLITFHEGQTFPKYTEEINHVISKEA
jgi:hypothetical protein